MNKTSSTAGLSLALLGLALATAPAARAAEGFQIRYNLAGSLGGELFQPPEHAGLFGAVAVTYADVKKVTGDDGQPIAKQLPGGTIQIAPGLSASYPASRAVADATGTLTLYNLGLVYITPRAYADGRLVFGLNIPYSKKKQNFQPIATTPGLTFSPGVPAPVQAATTRGFDAKYQGDLAARARAEGGDVSGLGDIELSTGWLFTSQQWRILTGVALALPTGKHDPNPGGDAGYGNFYTLRPSLQATWLPRPDISLAGKLTLGFNTTNRDNNLHSGNWAGLELATGYMTRLGPVGIHMVHVQQYQDDRGNVEWGASRYRTSNAGLFWTTKLPVIDTIMTMQIMKTLSTRNAKDSTITQVRFIKAF